MKKKKVIFPVLVLLLIALACVNPFSGELPDVTIVDKVIPRFGSMLDLKIEPGAGNGSYKAILRYSEGLESSTITCAYMKKDDPTEEIFIIEIFTINPGSRTQSHSMDFTEKRPAHYLAFCSLVPEEVTREFTVVSPYAGQYECENCFSETWAIDVDAYANPPRSMGRNLLKIVIDEKGNITGGYIFYEIYGTPPADYCVITRNAYESGTPSGSVNHDSKELIVDFLDSKGTAERGGGIQCDPPKTSQGGAVRFFFQFNDNGDLLLCKPFETGQSCVEAPIAVLMKTQ